MVSSMAELHSAIDALPLSHQHWDTIEWLMVVRSAEQKELAAHGIRGGHGEAYSRFLSRGEGKSQLEAIALNRLPPGSSWGPKKHADAEEFFFVVSGEAEVLDDGERHMLVMGDLIHARPGDMLAIRNSHPEHDLVFLAGLLKHPTGFFR